MVTISIEISQRVLDNLQKQAEREKKSVEQIASTLIEKNINDEYDEAHDPLLLMAKMADELNLSSGRSDLSENSRELIGRAIEDHYNERMNENAEQNSD